MGEKIQQLVDAELDRIPADVKPFIRKATGDPDADSFMDMGFMAYAYGQAFENLAEPALAHWPKRDYMAQPMVYLARHSMELHLKRTIKLYQEYLGDETKIDHHRLMDLWNLMVKLVKQAGYSKDEEYGPYCAKLLHQLDEADPDGERYRYPHDTKGKSFGFTKVELEGLVKAYGHVSSYAEATGDMLAELAPEDE